jgi:BclB C-terminal domain-containing protein
MYNSDQPDGTTTSGVQGKIGIGTNDPQTTLHIVAPAAGQGFTLDDKSQGDGYVLTSDANGKGQWKPASSGGGAIIPFSSGMSAVGLSVSPLGASSSGYVIGFGNLTAITLDSNGNITSDDRSMSFASFAGFSAPRDGTITSMNATFMFTAGGISSGGFTIYVQLYENMTGSNAYNKIGDAVAISNFNFATKNDSETVNQDFNIPVTRGNKYLVVFYGTSGDLSTSTLINGYASAVLNIQ